MTHASDCAIHNEPALPPGLCDCGVPDCPGIEPPQESGVREPTRADEPTAYEDAGPTLTTDSTVPEDPPMNVRRERGMNDMAAVLQSLYGDRCTRREGGCTCCAVWAIFDALDTMTDSSVFADDLQKPTT